MTRIQQITSLLKSESTLVLATTSASGESRSTPLFYLADDELSLYWFSSASSGHSTDLKRDANAAATVYRPTTDWKSICGVQMRGTVATIIDRSQRKTITYEYCRHFRLGTLFRATLSRSTLYVFRPSWVRYIDNARRFGFKFELSLHDQNK